jgi:predicted Na+-dependent transporter
VLPRRRASTDVGRLAHRLRTLLGAYPELICVLLASIFGLSVQSPLAWLDTRQGIDVLLAVLVFATALTIEPTALLRLGRTWRPLLAAVTVGILVLPVLSWLASRLVAAGSLRDGVMVVGLAPCEIASVATTAMAGGESAFSTGVLVGSTLATVALVGPILGLESGHVSVHPARIVVNLALVVVLPLVAGIVVGRIFPLDRRAERAANATAIAAVAGLVALIAAEVHLSRPYLAVTLALAAFLIASAFVSGLVNTPTDRRVRRAILLTTSMRDFAIAADLASSAFGPAAAAPLGLYGILVLVWGTAAAGVLRHRKFDEASGSAPF